MTPASIRNLDSIIDTLRSEGVAPKVTLLKASKGSKTNMWASQIRGGSSRVRTHGGAAGSRGTSMTTKASALGDVN